MEHIKYILARKVVRKYVNSSNGSNEHHVKKDEHPLEHPAHRKGGERGNQGVLFGRFKLPKARV